MHRGKNRQTYTQALNYGSKREEGKQKGGGEAKERRGSKREDVYLRQNDEEHERKVEKYKYGYRVRGKKERRGV